MLSLAKKRGITPTAVVMDAWYSSLKNLKAIREHGWVWVTPLRKNRIVNRNVQLGELDIPEEGLVVHLRGYGWVTVFKFVAKNGRIDYVTTNGIERCQARTGRSQRNHICMAIIAWLDKHRRRINERLTFYQQDWNVIKDSITAGINEIMAYT